MLHLPHHPGVNCDNCGFAVSRHADDAARQRAEAAGTPHGPLQCRLNPLPVSVQPDHVCAQHSELAARRDLARADMIAIAAVKQAAERAGERVIPIKGKAR